MPKTHNPLNLQPELTRMDAIAEGQYGCECHDPIGGFLTGSVEKLRAYRREWTLTGIDAEAMIPVGPIFKQVGSGYSVRIQD